MNEAVEVVGATSPATAISFKNFLESVAPLETRRVVVATEVDSRGGLSLKFPAIELFCEASTCGGLRFHDPSKEEAWLTVREGRAHDEEFVFYFCRNCREFGKEYAIDVSVLLKEKFIATIYKIGENPRFGEPRPDIITDALDDEIEYFDRGYRAETAGLGIGAFAYYRRFVESHKDKIIDKIREVAVEQGAPKAMIDALDRARKSISFERAVEEVKDAIPDSLKMVGGHNPLTILHKALSAGLHNDDDVECLEIARDIRTVLTGLAEKTTDALKRSDEMTGAFKRLMNRKPKSTT